MRGQWEKQKVSDSLVFLRAAIEKLMGVNGTTARLQVARLEKEFYLIEATEDLTRPAAPTEGE
jgi:hypothetical protein